MLDQVLKVFNIVLDYDLSIMKEKQTLFDVTVNILEKMKSVLEEVKSDVVLVHGDTSTTFVTSICRFRSGTLKRDSERMTSILRIWKSSTARL